MQIEVKKQTVSSSRKPRVYVNPKGESVLENLNERFDRPIELYREAAYEALKEIGVEGKLNWSQKAGCSRGCSPAFVFTGTGLRQDVYVSIVELDEPKAKEQAKEQAKSPGRGPAGICGASRR